MEKLLAAVTDPWAALIAIIFLCIMWMVVGPHTNDGNRRTLSRGFLGLALLVVLGVFLRQLQPKPESHGKNVDLATTSRSAAQDINVQETANAVTANKVTTDHGSATITGNSGTSNVGTTSNITTNHGTMNGNSNTYNFAGGTTVIDSGKAQGNGNNVSVRIGR